MRSVRILLLLAILIARASLLAAQSQITTGVIEGTVVDSSGAVLPGVDVEIRNVETNLVRTLVSDDAGRFAALQLPPGRYTAKYTLSGFATLVQENVVVTVGETVRLAPAMKLSNLAETVTVSAESPTIDTARTAAASTLDQTTIETTPILGRKFEDLLTLTPGVSIVQGPDGDEINFVGQRGVFNNISLDGGDYNNGFFGEQAGGQRAAIDITLEAVKQFQVIATGASAEFGRTAGGVVNVITNQAPTASTAACFYYQRLEALTSNTSDGKPLQDFHREQFGGTIGGPLIQNKAFYFVALEGVRENLQRPNLSEPIGTPCPVTDRRSRANEALINGSADCQRAALLPSSSRRRGRTRASPSITTSTTTRCSAKRTGTCQPTQQPVGLVQLRLLEEREPDLRRRRPTADSANGTEGPSKINVLNPICSARSPRTQLNEFHVTYSREDRPRLGHAIVGSRRHRRWASRPTFRFGNPFFLAPNVDELVKRFQVKDNFSIVTARTRSRPAASGCTPTTSRCSAASSKGRYLFDSVTGFLRYASPAGPGGFGPYTVGCSDGTYVTAPPRVPAGTTASGGPLLFYLQSSSPDGVARDAAGASDINNEEFSLFVQDRWQTGARTHGRLRSPLGRAEDAVHRRPENDGVRVSPERSAVPV